MRHFPIFLDTRDARIVVSGAGAAAVAKLRLLLKTEADISVFGAPADPQVALWAKAGRITYAARPLEVGDLDAALLLYAAHDDPAPDAAAAQLGRAAGVKTLCVDNLEASDFITPAIVDRAPVTVAIGTEGAAPVLARRIKADLEAQLPAQLGALARIGQAFRRRAEALPQGPRRRAFWSRFYFERGPDALREGRAEAALETLLDEALAEAPRAGHVHFIGAGPGDPELLTLRARRLLHEADVVLHDGLVPDAILELARREAEIISVGKQGFGPSWAQDDINNLLVSHGRSARVVRLKSGDPSLFGRLDEETAALEDAGIAYSVTPGITSALAAAAELGQSLTRRGRNSEARILTGHDLRGFAEQDWRALARPGAVAAIYMGKRAAAFLRGRLLMHGADEATPVSVVLRASQPDQEILSTTLLGLPAALAGRDGPAMLLFGIARDRAAQTQKEAL